MKNIKLLILAGAILLNWCTLIAQDTEAETGPFETRMAFVCTSSADDSIHLRAVITVKREEGPTNLANAPVVFSVVTEEGETELGTIKTDIRGTAVYKVPLKNPLPRNEEQLINFKAVFSGTDKYEGTEGEFALKPAKLTVSFYEEDSIRYVKVDGIQYTSDGSELPLGPADLIISVPKMFSNLKIAEISLDSTGSGYSEFPAGIIGDSTGKLIVIASLDEHEVFGSVRGESISDWGLQKHLISPDRPSRELWTPIAPLWMIITLIIMLTGVWGHYVYAIVQLVLIKRSSRNKKEEEEALESDGIKQ